MMAFIIWSVCAGIFLIIGVVSYKSEKEAGFFTGVNPPKMNDVKAYNHAVGKLWFVFSILYESAGIPLIGCEQNSPSALISVVLVFALVIGMMIAYMKIEAKYRER